MRIAAAPSDPDHVEILIQKALGRRPVIFVDGVQYRDVTVADEDRGYVTYLPRDASGALIRLEDRYEECRIDGKVEIRWEKRL